MSSTQRCLVVGWLRVLDTSAFADYRDAVPATLIPYDGKILGRGSFAADFVNQLDVGLVDGLALLEFPDAQTAKAWAEGAEYSALLAVRTRAIELTLRAFEG